VGDDTGAGDQATEESDASEQPVGPAGSGAGELLRDALVDDDDPRFPIWLPLPGIAATAGWALYDANVGTGAFLPALLWPGAGIFVLTTLATWLGWQLDID
jgi:hypothetical protein